MFKFILPKFQFKVEKWQWNKEFRIYVSTLGNFKDEHKNNIPIKINNNGYVVIKTAYGFKLAHRLVMFTFKPIPNAESLTVDHLNHNKRDNSVYNLEWVSKKENWKRATEDYITVNLDYEHSAIGSGKFKFKDLEDAAIFAINAYNIKADKQEVTRKINNAITNDKMYCGRKWFKIGE